MKNKTLLLIFLFLFTLSSYSCYSQVTKPPDWPETIQKPWYQGTVESKPVFVYLDALNRENGYFFIAYNAVPNIYQLKIKWKNENPRSATFRMQGKKTKVKFTGSADPGTIAGIIRMSGGKARRLNVPKELPLYLTLEKPVVIPSLTHRYTAPIFKWVDLASDISYGAASGYYVSMPVETNAGYDYQQIILDAMKRMYVNPTKEAILHILNKDPVSLVLTDLQGLRFDLYQPKGDPLTNRPLIVMMHGGAFIMGDKATGTISELAENFARKGYVVAAINYRMGFNPASKSSLERSAYRAVQDARAALRFLSYNADTYKIDPNCIFLAGSSAGAITALNTAFMKEDERPESTKGNFWQFQKDLGGLDESTNTFQNTYTIRAVLNLWGAVQDTNLIDGDENIPVLNFHGDADKIVPCGHDYPFTDLDTSVTSNIVTKMYGSICIHDRLLSQGIHSELVLFPGAGHEPQTEAGNYSMVMDTITARTTDFYLRALFYFPHIEGPDWVSTRTSLPAYSVRDEQNVSYFWKVTGGKIIPCKLNNLVEIVWLGEGKGTVSLQLIHNNQASLHLDFPVIVPDKISNYYPVSKK
jgi:pimeloyl-ACP methyl ester carboxylesterase